MISGIKIILANPILILYLFTFDFHKIYCSYWKLRLKQYKKFYDHENAKNEKDLFEEIKERNDIILNKKYSRYEAYLVPLYVIIRKLRPDIVVETGVHRGVSSLFILQALEDNGHGNLYSIDLPFAQYVTDHKVTTKSFLPPEKVGVCVPDKLRKRWNLILGDSKKELPTILKKVGTVDLFLHDSQHTYEHMMWEFENVWPYLNTMGVLISDDTNWNDSFETFAKNTGCKNIQLRRDKLTNGTFGIILKNEIKSRSD